MEECEAYSKSTSGMGGSSSSGGGMGMGQSSSDNYTHISTDKNDKNTNLSDREKDRDRERERLLAIAGNTYNPHSQSKPPFITIPPSHIQSHTHPNNPSVKVIHLLVMDNTNTSQGSNKPSQVLKEKNQIERKVNIFASNIWGNVNVITTMQSQRMKGYVSVQEGAMMIIACDLSFHVLREFDAMVTSLSSTKPYNTQSQSTITTTIDSLYSSPSTLQYKKTIKSLINELSSHSTYTSTISLKSNQTNQANRFNVNNLYSPVGGGTNISGGKGSSSGSWGGISGGSNAQNAQYQANSQWMCKDSFLYSIIDDKFDYLSYSPSALSKSI